MSADARLKNQTIAEVDQQGQYIMDSITQSIRAADSIAAPSVGATGTTLRLAMPAPSASPYTFSLNGSALQLQEGVSSAVRITSTKLHVNNLTFTNVSRPGTTGAVRVRFDLARTNPSGRNAYDYQKTFMTTASLRP